VIHTAPGPLWNTFAGRWLTLRRIRAQAAVLAFCIWSVCLIDLATPGLFDRAGNIKFQDFLPIYISARFIAQQRASELYDSDAEQRESNDVLRVDTQARLTYLYGPQVALLFLPLAGLPFALAAGIWAALGALIYLACVHLIWSSCPRLRFHTGIVVFSALAFPPLFHCFVRGQLSALLLACFTCAALALRSNRPWLAGAAFGFLSLKPTFLAAIPLIVLFVAEWKILSGLLISAGLQLALARLYFGPEIMRSYMNLLLRPSPWIDVAELSLAPIQMHSLRSFWTLLIPSSSIALGAYILSSIAIMALTVVIWKSQSPIALRFSALTFAAVLVNPHLFVYDLLVLAPALMLLIDWTLANPQHDLAPQIQLLAYLAFILPLLGPLSRWTHVQLSVPVFVAIVWTMYRSRTAAHKLASNESRIV